MKEVDMRGCRFKQRQGQMRTPEAETINRPAQINHCPSELDVGSMCLCVFNMQISFISYLISVQHGMFNQWGYFPF